MRGSGYIPLLLFRCLHTSGDGFVLQVLYYTPDTSLSSGQHRFFAGILSDSEPSV
jgi:hypothetical protein